MNIGERVILIDLVQSLVPTCTTVYELLCKLDRFRVDYAVTMCRIECNWGVTIGSSASPVMYVHGTTEGDRFTEFLNGEWLVSII